MNNYDRRKMRKQSLYDRKPIVISRQNTQKTVSREIIVAIALATAAVTGVLVTVFRLAY